MTPEEMVADRLRRVADGYEPIDGLEAIRQRIGRRRRRRMTRRVAGAAVALAVAVGASVSASLAAGSGPASQKVATAGRSPQTGGPARLQDLKVRGLAGVSCVSADWCVAVGGHNLDAQPVRSGQTGGPVLPASADRTLQYLFDGHRWTAMGAGPVRNLAGGLVSVSCTSRSWCVAVGTRDTARARPPDHR